MNMKKRWVKRVEGRRVADPDTNRRVTDEPVEVPDIPFWRNCIANGDVAEVDKPSESIPPSPTAVSKPKRQSSTSE